LAALAKHAGALAVVAHAERQPVGGCRERDLDPPTGRAARGGRDRLLRDPVQVVGGDVGDRVAAHAVAEYDIEAGPVARFGGELLERMHERAAHDPQRRQAAGQRLHALDRAIDVADDRRQRVPQPLAVRRAVCARAPEQQRDARQLLQTPPARRRAAGTARDSADRGMPMDEPNLRRVTCRAVLGGLAAFGQSGVEAVIDILNRELPTIMRQAGTPTLANITPERVASTWR
jgi:hypothetical protein